MWGGKKKFKTNPRWKTPCETSKRVNGPRGNDETLYFIRDSRLDCRSDRSVRRRREREMTVDPRDIPSRSRQVQCMRVADTCGDYTAAKLGPPRFPPRVPAAASQRASYASTGAGTQARRACTTSQPVVVVVVDRCTSACESHAEHTPENAPPRPTVCVFWMEPLGGGGERKKKQSKIQYYVEPKRGKRENNIITFSGSFIITRSIKLFTATRRDENCKILQSTWTNK